MEKNSLHSDLRSLADRLFAENCSCVIRNGDRIRSFHEKGVKDLFRLLHEEPDLLDGASIADKIVGKGAAALMISGGVKAVFSDVISSQALALFRNTDIHVEFTLEVPNIINRTKTGICPVEELCKNCKTAGECLPLITDFIARQRQKEDKQ